MNEKRIDFKTAKLAYEKGLVDGSNSRRNDYYILRTGELNGHCIKTKEEIAEIKEKNSNAKMKDFLETLIPAPTQSALQTWLRDVHKIDVRIFRDYQFMIKNKNLETQYYDEIIYDSYEAALEIGLQNALTQIGIKQI